MTTEQISQTEMDSWTEPPAPERFSVHDDESANWLVRRILEARAYAARCEAWADLERRRAFRDEESLMFRFGPQLRDYVQRKIMEQGGRRKSVSFPAGTVGFRTQGAKVVVEDEGAVLEWARANCPAIIRVTEQLSKTALNAHVEASGELPARGVRVEPAHEKFYLK